ncbi:glycosyltransferase family 2 protein [Thalassococcus sp. S3]|uniref:glycosyltransferase family 2 protein n=1 Tax=Thalassococcus sp. S3 TaxID=2017482 RepID=UPI00102428A9|nr:glycosyltransferase family 2 protein [Thalassococcus sp. S3]QBF31985.1 glycosyl transferase [Thalassococcus sp. S3]
MSATLLTIVLNWRTPEMSLKAAEAALADMEGLDAELVLVDNDSQDGSFETMAQAAEARGWTEGGRVRVVQSGRNGGFGAGNNVGMRLGLSSGAAPDFIYILNSDAWPDRGAIPALLDHMRRNPGVGIAGSHVRGEDDAPHITLFRFPSIAGEFEGAARTGVISRLLANAIVPLPIPTEVTAVDWLAGASMMMRREMLDRIGLFDETFFLYYEETDLCRRAAKAGWRTDYLPQSRVVHIGSVSTGMKTWARTPDYWFASRRYYFVKNHGAFYAAAATLARIAGQAIWEVRRAVSGKPQADPDRFLRDLIAHALRAPKPLKKTARTLHPATEDRP